jgi:hypothetical protein
VGFGAVLIPYGDLKESIVSCDSSTNALVVYVLIIQTAHARCKVEYPVWSFHHVG